MFLKISVLKNFEMFTVKYLCWSLLFNDAAGCIPKTSLKRTLLPEYRFNKVLGIQPGDFEKWLKTLSSRKRASGFFWIFTVYHAGHKAYLKKTLEF